MQVLSIRPAKNKGYIRVIIEGIEGFIENIDLTVSQSEYALAGSPLTGDEITTEEYEILALSDERYRAKKSALSILSYADNSILSLVRKLLAKGISKEVAEETAREMVSLGYINERRQLLRLVKSEANNNLRGPSLIISRLSAKGYPRLLISSVIKELEGSGEIDFESVKSRLISRRLANFSTEEIKKLLYKNGF